MTDLTQLTAERDAARMLLHRTIDAMLDDENERIDALLLAEHRLAVAEACEALESKEVAEDLAHYVDDYAHQPTHAQDIEVATNLLRCTARLLRACLTPEET